MAPGPMMGGGLARRLGAGKGARLLLLLTLLEMLAPRASSTPGLRLGGAPGAAMPKPAAPPAAFKRFVLTGEGASDLLLRLYQSKRIANATGCAGWGWARDVTGFWNRPRGITGFAFHFPEVEAGAEEASEEADDSPVWIEALAGPGLAFDVVDPVAEHEMRKDAPVLMMANVNRDVLFRPVVGQMVRDCILTDDEGGGVVLASVSADCIVNGSLMGQALRESGVRLIHVDGSGGVEARRQHVRELSGAILAALKQRYADTQDEPAPHEGSEGTPPAAADAFDELSTEGDALQGEEAYVFCARRARVCAKPEPTGPSAPSEDRALGLERLLVSSQKDSCVINSFVILQKVLELYGPGFAQRVRGRRRVPGLAPEEQVHYWVQLAFGYVFDEGPAQAACLTMEEYYETCCIDDAEVEIATGCVFNGANAALGVGPDSFQQLSGHLLPGFSLEGRQGDLSLEYSFEM